MKSSYQFLFDSMHELQAEASAKGGHNPRSQMILDLLADYKAMEAAAQLLEEELNQQGGVLREIARNVTARVFARPEETYMSGYLAGIEVGLKALDKLHDILEPPSGPDAK